MKILITFLFLLFPLFALAAEGDVYFCQEDFRYAYYPSEGDVDFIKYKPQKFQFKRTATKLIFGNQKNWFEDAELDIIFSGLELFYAHGQGNDSDVFKYQDGQFFYSYASYSGITSTSGTCSVF